MLTVPWLPPVDCRTSEWSDWSPCNGTCGSETQTRYRRVVQQPFGTDALGCPSQLSESRSCARSECVCQAPFAWSSCANACPTDCRHLPMARLVNTHDDIYQAADVTELAPSGPLEAVANSYLGCYQSPGECLPGCRCPEAWLLQNGVCVPLAECQCRLPKPAAQATSGSPATRELEHAIAALFDEVMHHSTKAMLPTNQSTLNEGANETGQSTSSKYAWGAHADEPGNKTGGEEMAFMEPNQEMEVGCMLFVCKFGVISYTKKTNCSGNYT
ncbi:unnamed protein product [Protopolystoma xenopodis]|uniref:Spondin-like TSP1 domain-containing protein n=1 Tax=Protopolystoma xenopodis TaxID=117903 RepID=A0A3S5C592_9PLAT|nr:unnamed protein product [Protopolystoma xenopodis]